MAQLIDKLITFAYLKQEIDLPSNIDDQEFDHKIYRAQERLRMIMGDAFYRDFLTNYKASTFSSVYQELYDPYVKQFIAWQANVYWTVEANLKPTRAGFRVHSEENSEAANAEQMSMLVKDRKQQAEYYMKLLVDYMNLHSADLPLYNSGCGTKNFGNSFHISAARKHGRDCNRNRCKRW